MKLPQQSLLTLLLTWFLVPVASAVSIPNFLEGEIPGVGEYPVTAELGLDTPTGINFLTGEFTGFDNVVDHVFTVTGTVRIQSSGAQESFSDPTSGTIGPVAIGKNLTVQQEIVDISNVVINSTTAAATNIRLGDTIDGITDNGPQGSDPRSFFSTGGASQTSDGATTAEAFLNLYLEVDVTSPTIPGLGVAPGPLHNKDVALQLTKQISTYLPFGETFTKIGGPVELFTRGAGSPLNNALEFALPALDFPDPVLTARFLTAEITIMDNESASVPEPASAVYAGLGLVLLVLRKRRNQFAR